MSNPTAIHDVNAIADVVRTQNPGTLTSKAASAAVVKSVFDAILTAVQNGESVRIHGFGVFSVGDRAARKGRNPQTGATIAISASHTLKFKPSKATKKGALA